jgi:surfeit locus 1 family protein
MTMMRRVAPVSIFIVGFALLCSLGFWQLNRAEEKRVRHATFTERSGSAPLPFELIAPHAPPVDYLWRRTTLTGRYLETQVLLDNRIYKGRAGYEVMTPFESEGGRTILVNRGWIPLEGRRDVVPDVQAPVQSVTLSGYLGAEPVVGITLPGQGDAIERLSPTVFRVQRASPAKIAEVLGIELWPAVVYLGEGSVGALTVDWAPPGDGSARHSAYAVQWFAMAGVVVVFGLWFLSRRGDGSDA